MNTNVAGWIKVASSGAAGASAVIVAADMNMKTVVIACLAFLVGAGTAASAFLQAPPTKAP